MSEGQSAVPATGDNYFGVALNLLAEQKDLSPPQLLALLSLTNLLGIVTYVNTHFAGPAALAGGRSGFDKQSLLNMLTSLLATGGDSNKKEVLSTLMNILSSMASQSGAGGKKPDPVALMNLLSALMPPAAPEPGKAKYASDEPATAKEVATSSEQGRKHA